MFICHKVLDELILAPMAVGSLQGSLGPTSVKFGLGLVYIWGLHFVTLPPADKELRAKNHAW